MKFFPNQLLQAREARLLTQAELAEKVGVSSRTIQKWESGESTPYLRNVLSLASSLMIPPSRLADGIEVLPEPIVHPDHGLLYPIPDAPSLRTETAIKHTATLGPNRLGYIRAIELKVRKLISATSENPNFVRELVSILDDLDKVREG